MDPVEAADLGGRDLDLFFAAEGEGEHRQEGADEAGPYGAKSMSESPYNPVLSALGNALRVPCPQAFEVLRDAARRDRIARDLDTLAKR